METYVTVAFWLGIFAIIINLLVLMIGKFPLVRTETLGYKVATILISTGFAVWAGFLLFA